MIFLVSASISLYRMLTETQYHREQITPLKSPSNDSPVLPSTALRELWKQGTVSLAGIQFKATEREKNSR